jgi:NADH-quinone oxidoreductase subunit F
MMKIVVGEGSCGIAAGAEKVRQALLKQDLNGAKLTIAGCIGMCYLEPIVDIYEDNQEVKRLVRVTENDAEKISEYAKTGDESFISSLLVSDEDKEFLNKQTRIALRRCGIINPDEIDDFVNADGYTAIKKVLTSMTPEDVIEVIKTSGLAGRGGAGFPTWFKWNAARQSEGEEKYLICNADEGDPGAFMDRAVIESDPHTLIEGMLIGAYAIGAKNAVVYVRAEYPLAIKRLERAIEQATAAGYLGDNILGTDFSCKMTIKAGAGAFVCGEETALIESLEGHRGMPRLKPPFPAQSGYWKKPSNINNVETFANVSWIINNGGEAFAAMGTEGSKGTKVFAVTGKVKRSGLVEIPMGKTLRDVIFDIGGGMKGDKAFKAVQMGGPSGGCIPADLIDTVIDYKALGATGAIMGSGGMVVMDEGTCMVGMAKFFLDFTAKESCGKCIHCRIGTKRMLEILTRITEGNGQPGDVELLEELCYGIKDGALCGLGQTAPNPVLTTIKYFRNEYDAHINDKKCPAGECSSLIEYSIDKDKCKGCTLCARNCPVGAISGEVKSAHTIDINKCIKCGKCIATCRFGAVVRK